MKYKYLLLALCFSITATTSTLSAQTKALDMSGMDLSVNPGDDFNTYVNGTWLRKTEIPSDQSRWGSFVTLREENNKKLRKIMEDAVKKASGLSPAEQKMADFYATAMDTMEIEKQDFKPIKIYLGKVENIADMAGIQKEIAFMHIIGMNPLYTFYAYQDDKNSTKVVPQLYQPRLGLPEKGYYLDNDANKAKIREAYAKYIQTVFEYTGTPDYKAKEIAANIIRFETQLARVSKSAIELRDPEANYNKMHIKDLQVATPFLDWKIAQGGLMISQDTFLVGQPEYFKALSKELGETKLSLLRNYLQLQYITTFAPYLSKRFQDAAFNFNKEFTGQKQQQERGKRMVDLVNSKLGELVGEVYVQKYFPPAAKARMLELVKNLQVAYQSRILSADWMAKETKEKAVRKLNGMILKIGYPDKWKDYSSLNINRTSLVQNVVNSNLFEYNQMIRKLKKPVDKTEWLMTPAVVNAYYNPQTNEIAFPAGILQPPFFNMDADDAINYGAIGAVIGHEMTHGFDDQGRLYDVDGNLGDWWTESDAKIYKERANRIVEQYNAFTVFDTVHIKGELTLGENIADLGGLAIAYDAFKSTPQGKSDTKIDGYTPDQRFFLGFGQIWRAKGTQKYILTKINTDSHSPEEFRVKGTVTNFTPWYKAFNVNESHRMWRSPEKRTQIW